jgi:hypothetical protein
LRASGRRFCLLVNFQKPKVEWKRIVLGFQTPQRLAKPGAVSQVAEEAYLATDERR